MDFICAHFNLTEDAAAGLLQVLITQGHIVEQDSASCATGQCSSHCRRHQTSYLWVDNKLKPFPKQFSIQVKQL